MVTRKSGQPKTSKRSSDAAGQALGFGLQYTRLTSMLLQASEGSFCSFECLDDVAEDSPRDGARRVQTKSALTANPVADRAVSLWKTFSNWVKETAEHDFSAAPIIFELYVSRQVGGELVEAFSAASSDVEAAAALANARKKLWGEAPRFEARADLSPEIAPYVNFVLGSDDSILVPIIRGFQLVCGSGRPNADLEDLIRTHPIPPSRVRQVTDYICGVVKRRVDELLELSRPAILSRDDIYTAYRAYVRKVDSDLVLMSYAKQPSRDEALRSLPAVFVSQLHLIDLDFEDQLGAINDYLMACADRTEWALGGDVDESSFRDLDDALTRAWKNRKRSLSLQHRDLRPEEQGELVYRDCLQTKASLQAKDTPTHFIPGCLHRLADELTIGWHPRYDTLLKLKKAA